MLIQSFTNLIDSYSTEPNIEFVLFTNTVINEDIIKSINELSSDQMYADYTLTIYGKTEIESRILSVEQGNIQVNKGELEFLIYEVHTWLNETTIQFNDEDMWRWINTADAFDLRIYLHDYEYTVSSSIIDLLEDQYSMAFYNTLYSIELSSM